MNTLAERLLEARTERDWTQAELAKAAGVKNQSTIGMLESGVRKTSSYVPAIAATLGVSALWLAEGRGPKYPSIQLLSSLEGRGEGRMIGEPPPKFRPIIEWEKPEDLPEGQYVIVPRVRVRLSAGNGTLVFEEEEGEPLAFTTRWVKMRGLTRSLIVLVQATGDSMEPRIQDGDLLLINRSNTDIQDGNVYALRYGDQLRVKRLYRRYDTGLIIRSDNANKYPDEAVPREDLKHIEIIGRVVWVAGEM